MSAAEQTSSRKQWRSMVKKLRRKKIRQKAAQERDRILQEEENAHLKDPNYQLWLQQQAAAEEFQRQTELAQQLAAEEQWLYREEIAQKQFRIEFERQKLNEAQREAERLELEKQLLEQEEEKQRQREEKQRRAREATAEFERMLELMDKYLTDDTMDIPAELKRYDETHPGRELCHFFERTNCCRFGFPCINNHRRPLLSRILLVRHFFQHPALEHWKHSEYGSDHKLEYTGHDLIQAYHEFFHDVVSEMESFGKIVNFRTVNNLQAHLLGNVFIEYANERSALKAFIKLQGRYYATKRLNVEFSNITVWRTAICGLSFSRKCPQGRYCLYLHLFSNPKGKYNEPLEVTGTKRPIATQLKRLATPLISWTNIEKSSSNEERRNWRWSESPEMELKSKPRERDKSKERTSRDEKRSDDNKRQQRRSSESKVSKYNNHKNDKRSHSSSSSRRDYKESRSSRHC